MIYLASIGSACSDPGLAAILSIVKKVITIIQIIGPILALISFSYHLTMMVKNPDDKKGLPKIRNSAIALVVLFLVPFIVNAFFGMLDDSTTFSSCWNNSSSVSPSSSYIPIDDDGDRSTIITNPSDYQKGKKQVTKPQQGTPGKQGTTPTPGQPGTTITPAGGQGDRSGEGNQAANKVVFIGDSRTVQMYAYLNNNWSGANYSSGGVHVVGNDIYVAQGAMGLDWMKSTGIPAAKQYFGAGSAIVILMGVNDLSNANNYISYVNSNAASWKSNGSSLYYVSVNPCDGNYSHLNSKIQTFNATVKSGLSSNVGWIDTYSQLVSSGYQTTDGLHYDKSTYNAIYNYIKSRV